MRLYAMDTSSAERAQDRPQRADARRNRERILAAAKAIFAEEGIGAQMDDVARAAGVGVGTVYRHFPTKDALMECLVAEHFEAIITIEREALAIDDPWEAFAATIRNGARLMADDTHMRQAMLRFPDSAWEHAQPQNGVVDELGDRIIRRAQAAGVLREDFSVADMPMIMGGLCASIGIPGADWRRHVEILLAGLRA
ncbi:MAG: TetR/AcrR family transcriptional regulator [Solirubrobacteraceae bacterium]